MDLVNPFTEVEVFGKAYPVAWPPQGETRVKALLPTGRHVGHGLDLKRVRNSSGGGGKATKLERYTTNGGGGKATKLERYGHRRTRGALGLQHTSHKARGFQSGPFKKGLFGGGKKAAQRAGALRGLKMTKPGYTKDWNDVTMPLRRPSGGPSIRRNPRLSADSPMASGAHRSQLEFDSKPLFPQGRPVHGNGSRNRPVNSSIPTGGKTGRRVS